MSTPNHSYFSYLLGKRKRPTLPPDTMVHWVDAATSEHNKTGLSDVHTIGFIVEEDEYSILLAMEHHIIDDEVSYRHHMRIPKINIVKEEK